MSYFRIRSKLPLEQRRPYAPFEDHVFISLRRKPLRIADADAAFRSVVAQMGLPVGGRQRRPTLHSLRHTFAVKSLMTCPDEETTLPSICSCSQRILVILTP